MIVGNEKIWILEYHAITVQRNESVKLKLLFHNCDRIWNKHIMIFKCMLFEIHFIEMFKIGGLVGCVKYSLNLIRGKVSWNRCKTCVLCQSLMPSLLSLIKGIPRLDF